MGFEIFGDENRGHLKVYMYDRGGEGLDEFLVFKDPDSHSYGVATFWWNELRDIFQQIRKYRPKLWKLLTEEK